MQQLLAECGAAMFSFLWAVTNCLYGGFDDWIHGERCVAAAGQQEVGLCGPVRLLAKLYDTYDHKLTSEDGADAGEACELLLQRCTYASAVMWNLETPQLAFGGRMVTVTELTRAHFNEHRPHTDVLVFNLNPVVGGRVNWCELLVAPPAGEVWTFSEEVNISPGC